MSYRFAAPLFLSAALLFWIEPLVGKIILPRLGGSPAVWNSCLLFFQSALLVGYWYAHVASGWLRTRSQMVLQLVLLSLALLELPIVLDAEPPEESDPTSWLLRLLTKAVGLPFIAAAASAPLLQRWLATTGRDPYFLYAASNLGSLLGLLAFPLLLEPTLPLSEQTTLWAGGFALLLLLTASCVLATWGPAGQKGDVPPLDRPLPRLPLRRRLHWLMLALVPSSLLLGVTTHITIDLAAVPLLWVIPLALYLLSFALVFARRPPLPHRVLVGLLPLVALAVGFDLASNVSLSSWPIVPLHWLALFVAAMVCHGELARDRPEPTQLTTFYLWIALGGVVGGLLNVFVAPLVFQGRALEYPLVLLLACLLAPYSGDESYGKRCLAVLAPCAVGLLALVLTATLRGTTANFDWPGPLLTLSVPLSVGLAFSERPVHFAVPLLAALLYGFAGKPTGEPILYTERNFFGLLSIQDDAEHRFRTLSHGSTQHGKQPLGADGQPLHHCEPTGYYDRSGPIGAVFRRLETRPLPRHVAIIGLGAGGLASYARHGEEWTFYEIDPAVERVARDPHWFTYLTDAEQRGAAVQVILGDARLRLRSAPEHGFDVIVQDAFSSDAVPIHLITRQAVDLYRAKMAPGGLLAFHVSNRYLDLRPVLADLGRDAGMVCYAWHDQVSKEQRNGGKDSSSWVVLADRVADLGPLAHAPWRWLDGDPGRRGWTDDFSNIWQVFRFPHID